jgi:hypothetical protein
MGSPFYGVRLSILNQLISSLDKVNSPLASVDHITMVSQFVSYQQISVKYDSVGAKVAGDLRVP